MKTQNILYFFGGGHGAKSRVAREIGISAAAVSKWGEDVPEGSAYRLLVKYPALADYQAPAIHIDSMRQDTAVKTDKLQNV